MTLRQLFWFLAALFVLTGIALIRMDIDLRSVHAPVGIVSFEFCGFTASCALILDEWGAGGREIVMLSLGLDYLFLLSYACMLCVALLAAREGLQPRSYRIVGLIAAGAAIAGLADAIENYALIQVVLDNDSHAHGLIAAIFASIKFGLVTLALLTWVGLVLRSSIAKLNPQ